MTLAPRSHSAFASIGVCAVIVVAPLPHPAHPHRVLARSLSACLLPLLKVIGYGMAGIFYRYVVLPAHMWWPDNLIAVSLFR